MADDIAIKVDNVSKTFKLPHEKNTSLKSALINFRKRGYEKQRALDDISFEVKKGEFFGIVGRNGSGKSTLLKLLAGIYSPDTGGIQVNGKLTPFIELGVGFSPELTGRENVFLNGALLGFNRKEMEAMYDDIVKFAELKRFMDQKLKNYSSGMQVRLAFSIAIRARSDILVLDEVLAVGDAAFQKKCFQYFARLKDEKKTVVLVTHDMSSVEKYCDKAILINNGKIEKNGEPDDIAAEYRLINLSNEERTDSFASGPGGAVISKVTINDHANAIIKGNQTITVAIEYTVKKQTKVTAGLSIIRDDNTFIAHYNNKDQKEEDVLTCYPGKTYMAICEAASNQLLGGGYSVDVALYDPNESYLDRKPNVVQFAIPDTGESKGGAMNLQGSWKFLQN